MKYGTKVYVDRGGACKSGPGRKRRIVGTVIGSIGREYIVRLEQDDQHDTVGWRKRGDVGHFSQSAVTPLELYTNCTKQLHVCNYVCKREA